MSFKILLVDDEKLVRSAIMRCLRKMPIEMIEAESGETALGLLKEQQFDLLITDQKMPGLTGLELIAKVKELSLILPIVILSAHLDEQQIPAGVGFIPKPWEFEDEETGEKRNLIQEKIEKIQAIKAIQIFMKAVL
jgi:CheY-like chemotaxis protein